MMNRLVMSPRVPALFMFVLAAILFAGCKSTPKIDWNSRVGTYTYDEAVIELGPPEKTAKLSDGSTVADWVVGKKSSPTFSIGTGVYGSHGGVGVGQTSGGSSRLRILRLTFDDKNVLRSWSQN
jgi:hypothetical protein